MFRRNRLTGRLTQLGGQAGCIRPKGQDGCARARHIGDTYDMVASPDGRHLYRMSLLDPPELQLFRRERRSKILRPSRAPGGCFSDEGVLGCAPMRGVTYVDSGALSPDGRHLYAANADMGLAVFACNGRAGTLRQLRGAAGCVLENPDAGCGSARGLDGADFATVSPDGRNVYVSATFSLVAFARHRRTGELLQLPRRAGCIAGGLSDDYGRCAHPIQQHWGTEELAVSPDGRHLYAMSGDLLTVYARRTRP